MSEDEPSSLLRRVRWANVARAAGVVAALALVVAWPRLAGREPALPPAAPRPVVIRRPAPERTRAPKPARKTKTAAPRGAAARRPPQQRRRHRRRHHHSTARVERPTMPRVAPAPARPTAQPAATPAGEFDFG